MDKRLPIDPPRAPFDMSFEGPDLRDEEGSSSPKQVRSVVGLGALPRPSPISVGPGRPGLGVGKAHLPRLSRHVDSNEQLA